MSAVKNELKIIFWGTPEFALPSLGALIERDATSRVRPSLVGSDPTMAYRLVGVVTNPDEPVGRKQIMTAPPVKVAAKKHGIPVYQPASLKSDFPKEVRLLAPDLYIVAAYGKILPKEILDIPKFGALNLHPSLLPRWRGPSPIQYTILKGDEETGVTIMKMDEKMDHGPIVAVKKLLKSDFKPSKSDFPTLHNALAKLGAELLVETLPKYLKGGITPVSQDDSQATYSKILKKEDGRIDWTKSAEEIERMVRAFAPRPGAWTRWQERRIRIDSADGSAQRPKDASPGLVWQNDSGALFVTTGKGSLLIQTLTAEGGKTLSAEAFLRGHSSITGTVLR